MDKLNIIAQAVGFVAMALGIISYQFNDRKKILILQIFMSLTWTCHFLLLGVMTGAALNFIAAVKCFIFSKRSEKKWAQSKALPWIFAALFIIAGILTYEKFWSILSTAAMVGSVFVFWNENTKKIRMFNLPCSLLWLIYDFANGSVAGTANEIFVISSIIVAMFRFDKKEK